jgi:hypothetical protein
MIVVIYDEVTGTGSNANFRCVGFLRVTITAVKLTGSGKNSYIKGIVEQVAASRGVIAGMGLTSLNMFKVQLVK